MRILDKQDWYTPDKWICMFVADRHRFGIPLTGDSYLTMVRDLMLAGF